MIMVFHLLPAVDRLRRRWGCGAGTGGEEQAGRLNVPSGVKS